MPVGLALGWWNLFRLKFGGTVFLCGSADQVSEFMNVVKKELYDLYIPLAIVMLAYISLNPCGLVNKSALVPLSVPQLLFSYF
jgi:hypothetical protein